MIRRPPGPWLLVVSLVGWMLQVVVSPDRDPLGSMVALCSGGQAALPGLGPIGHEHRIGMLAWSAMVLGMAPLVRNEIAFLWSSTLPRRRWPAVAAFAGGYGLAWLALGLLWTGFGPFGRLEAGTIGLAAALVVAWHGSPARQKLLNDCHSLPTLRAFGPAMLADAGRFGLRSGGACCAICGPAMMIAMLLPDHHLVAMAIVTLLVTIERYLPARKPAWHLPWPGRRPEPHWITLTLPVPPAIPR